MNPFSMSGAWFSGFRFIAGRAAPHALVLIGIGVVAPFLLQYALVGEPLGTTNTALMGQAATGPGLAAGTMTLLAMALSYVLQTASYFASWRLGFGADRSLAGPILYGLAGGLLAVAVVVAVGSLAGLGAWRFGSPGVGFLTVLIVLIPLIAVVALFYTITAVLVAAAVSLLLSGAMVFGMITGQVGLAATLVGGDGGVVVLLLVLSAVLIWLAARLSCTTCVMADRKSFNLIAAIRESWRLTWDEQWAIVRYLALVGLGLALVTFALIVAVGAGASAMLEKQAGPELAIGTVILSLIAAVPLAFLTVMVPAGIYRELAGSAETADVFA